MLNINNHEENLKEMSRYLKKDLIKNRIDNNENIFTVKLKKYLWI